VHREEREGKKRVSVHFLLEKGAASPSKEEESCREGKCGPRSDEKENTALSRRESMPSISAREKGQGYRWGSKRRKEVYFYASRKRLLYSMSNEKSRKKGRPIGGRVSPKKGPPYMERPGERKGRALSFFFTISRRCSASDEGKRKEGFSRRLAGVLSQY